MSQSSKIEWTDATWNPTRGCSRVSEGCRNCYAERIAARFNRSIDEIPGPKVGQMDDAFHGFAIRTDNGPRWTGKVELIESKLLEPLHWRKPRRVFVNSMSDLFHENLPYPDILHVFQIMAKCPRHTFQILTKRPAKMRELLSLCWWRNLGHSPEMGGDIWAKVIAGEQRPGDRNFLPNVWLGVSVENQPTADERIPELLRTPAALRFVSYEPALAEVDFRRWLRGTCPQCHGFDDYCADVAICETCHGLNRVLIGWGIVGGESGPGARPFDIEWARNTVRQFGAAGVPLFVKQLGSNPLEDYDLLDNWMDLDSKGGNWEEWPEDLRIRQFPPTVTAL